MPSLPKGGGGYFLTLKIHPMLDAFIEYLDLIYYEGYAREFQESNPDTFYYQFAQFVNDYR